MRLTRSRAKSLIAREDKGEGPSRLKRRMSVGDGDEREDGHQHQSTSGSPQKRARAASPRTPVRKTARRNPETPAAAEIRVPVPWPLPTTPHTPAAYPARVSDSPGNPFGRKRRQTLARGLPASTAFSKHLALRFQVIRPQPQRVRGRRRLRVENVHRVVQVPLSYTFGHVRHVVGFLFPGVTEGEHVFEVREEARVTGGAVRGGEVWVKVSSVRDPCERGEDDEGDSGAEGWTWQAEDDFTLGHVWPGDLTRAIIFHADPETQIHISIATTLLPKRRGRSNTPYVFSGLGDITGDPAADVDVDAHNDPSAFESFLLLRCPSPPSRSPSPFAAHFTPLPPSSSPYSTFSPHSPSSPYASSSASVATLPSPLSPASTSPSGSSIHTASSPDSSPFRTAHARTLPLLTPAPPVSAMLGRAERRLSRLKARLRRTMPRSPPHESSSDEELIGLEVPLDDEVEV
ncbi:hypothetical protein BD779DRAFT_1545378 [Infundibulicybe gibba]|nr:hypothetical protein BD779DRAFT_1545378 [Infundibulicybe gibba]